MVEDILKIWFTGALVVILLYKIKERKGHNLPNLMKQN